MRAPLLTLVLALASAAGTPFAHADAQRGETLFRQNCAICHGSPSAQGGDAIAAGANRPDVIAAAFRSNAQMNVFASILSTRDIADLAEYIARRYRVPGPAPLPPETLAVVEYYNAGLDHYFITAIPGEIAALDTGTVVRGWARTGLGFLAWPTVQGGLPGATPVCRFYLPPASGDSHFYSASPSECGVVAERFPQFVAEGTEVMAVSGADPVNGSCPAGSQPVFRLWNQRSDSNHRYTTDRDVRAAMVGRGYFSEGYGPEGVAFCAPGP